MLAGSVEARDYNIVDYGARADTTVLSTKALQQAIDDCSQAGGVGWWCLPDSIRLAPSS